MSRTVIIMAAVAALVSPLAPTLASARGGSHFSNTVPFTKFVGSSSPSPQQRPTQKPPTRFKTIVLGGTDAAAGTGGTHAAPHPHGLPIPCCKYLRQR